MGQECRLHLNHVDCSLEKAGTSFGMAKYCAKMYAALEAGDSWAIASTGYKFVSQYLALEEHAVTWDPEDTKTWRARPKFYLLQHILDEACKGLHPKDAWAMQQLWFRRGGKAKSPKVESESILLRWANSTATWSLQKAIGSKTCKNRKGSLTKA